MAELIVNIALVAAVLVLLGTWAVSTRRRRHAERREHAAERRLILAAFTAAAPRAAAPSAPPEPDQDTDDHDPHVVPAAGRRGSRAANARQSTASHIQQPLDAASVAALLDLLEDRRPARRGMIAGLVTSPRSVWSAGSRAGQTLARRGAGEPSPHAADTAATGLYRDAASELVDIHAHDPADAHTEYTRYAAAVGDPDLAELYVRSAAYTTHGDHDQVRRVLDDIVNGGQPPELSDDDASIDA